MYRCQICDEQSKERETKFRLVTKKRILDKGFEISEEKETCPNCYYLHKNGKNRTTD
ncbi:MAG: hypothetical protein ACTSQA_00995 [Candidatus Heimdallarchaeaceae archaeon]